jgi:hypothetical protein
VVRLKTGRTDRGFEVRKDSVKVAFSAHLSQSGKGFWGLTSEKADEVLRGRREHLVLLTAADRGYFMSNAALQLLMQRFTGEDYLYPAARFAEVELPQAVRRRFLRAL